MTEKPPLAFMELLASKVCHDLISPIGAVNNGVEFLQDSGGGGEETADIVNLITYSAAQASARLQIFRLAYGAGGADTHIKPEDVHKAFQSLVVADNKIRQIWDPFAPLGPPDRPKGFCKMLACALMLGIECLPKGGSLDARGGKDTASFEVIARGTDATPRGQTEEALALSLKPETLDPKYVHAAMTGYLSRAYGFQVRLQTPEPETVVISITQGS